MFIHTELTPAYDLQTKDLNGMRFYQLPSGLFLPSVTTVLNYGDKPWLEDWKTRLGPNKAAQEQKRCADRGTLIHTMCEEFIQNKPVDDIVKDHPREYLKLFHQMRYAINKRINNIHLQEKVLFSDTLGIAGRVDLIAEYDGVLSVIDFKTSTNLKDGHNIENYFKQCTAYAVMVEEMYDIHIQDVVVMISNEKDIMAQVFKRSITDYIQPLKQSINTFYTKEINNIKRINSL